MWLRERQHKCWSLKQCSLNMCGIQQGQAATTMYQQFEADRDKGNFDTLPELHAVLSGMKVCLSCILYLCKLPCCTNCDVANQWADEDFFPQ